VRACPLGRGAPPPLPLAACPSAPQSLQRSRAKHIRSCRARRAVAQQEPARSGGGPPPPPHPAPLLAGVRQVAGGLRAGCGRHAPEDAARMGWKRWPGGKAMKRRWAGATRAGLSTARRWQRRHTTSTLRGSMPTARQACHNAD
jgi:hypothetical protein